MSKWPLVCLVASACANTVPQDRATGPDGKIKGATPIVMTEGEGKVKGVVTYPGGDRVDWKVVELPAGKKGRLDVSLTYTTPRPGLRLSFDVFDQWNTPVFEAAKRKGKVRSTTIDAAKGKYFIRVYAPRRTDAGAYKLTAEFHEQMDPKGFNPLELDIQGPPKLADVPPPPSTCEVFDPRDPACKGCPASAPADWKGCIKEPPAPPPDPSTLPPPPPPPAKPVTTRVLKVDVVGDGLDVTVGAGSETGIGKDWKVNILRGDSGQPLSGGGATIVRLNKTTTVIHVRLTTNQIGANPNVRLSAP